MVESSRVRPWESSPRAADVRRRAVLLSGLGLPLGLLAARAPQASAAAPATADAAATAAGRAPSPRLVLPAPTGPYRLGTVSLDLIDPSRPDPWVPSIPFREMVVSMSYPARGVDGHPREPYFTPIVARAYEQQIGVPTPLNWPITHAHLHAPVLPREGGWPVVLYAPGLGDERNDTTAIAEDLVSHGYVVVTIDFVHDSGVVELPDGRLEESAVPEPTLPVTIKEVVSRAEDVSFILDQLAVINRGGNPDHEQRPLPRGLRGSLNLDQTGMFGHSDGGSTAAHVMHADSRVKAGVDMDGTLWTPQAVAGSGGALLLFGEQTLAADEASSWDEFWAKQRGPKLQLSLLGSEHATFTDFAPLVPQAAPILGEPPSWVTELIGTINGPRAVTVERTYIRAWFDTYLGRHDSRLLAGPSPLFPEVQFVRCAD
jgi:predicted dienelactone hydrolase